MRATLTIETPVAGPRRHARRWWNRAWNDVVDTRVVTVPVPVFTVNPPSLAINGYGVFVESPWSEQ